MQDLFIFLCVWNLIKKHNWIACKEESKYQDQIRRFHIGFTKMFRGEMVSMSLIIQIR